MTEKQEIKLLLFIVYALYAFGLYNAFTGQYKAAAVLLGLLGGFILLFMTLGFKDKL